MNMSVSGLGRLRSSVAGMPIPQDRCPKTNFGSQMKQVWGSLAAEAKPTEQTAQMEGKEDIWELYTTYTPGFGYTANRVDNDEPVMAWGREFRELMAQRAREYAANKVEEPFTRKELTQKELSAFAAKLSEKYNPRNMTQQDYESFLEDLVAEGLLSKAEVETLGYKGLVVVGNVSDGSFLGAVSVETKTLNNNPYYNRYGLVSSLRDTNGDALAYAVLMSLWKNPNGSAAFLDFEEKRHNGYTIMADVLKAMDKCR